MKLPLEKLGSAGAVIAAAACPICFPKLALLGAVFGLGALGAYEAQLFIAAQVLVVIALAGHVLSYRSQRNARLLAFAAASAVAVFAGIYWPGSELLTYAGFAGLAAASVPALWRRLGKWTRRTRLTSVITCPACAAQTKERMPTDACQYMYACPACGLVMRPRRGDCCVFCSYGSVKCPPMQLEGERHGAAS